MSGNEPTLHVITPSLHPVGGVIKVLDYATHALAAGYRVSICSTGPTAARPDLPIFRVPALEQLAPGASPRVAHPRTFRNAPGPRDVVLFTHPPHWAGIAKRLPDGFALGRVLLAVQNVRHANPAWLGGLPVRLLSQPLRRFAVSQPVADAIAPLVDHRLPTHVVPIGHRADYFALARPAGLPRRLRVAYTTWKSDVGDRVADLLADDDRFELRGLGGVVAWPELRELYHWSDVFLGCPGAEEGFYLPGLEAMAAGAVVLMPDAGGNRAYCRFGFNCVHVSLDDARSYAEALRCLLYASEIEVDTLRREGYAEVARHSLELEQARFREVLDLASASEHGPVVQRTPAARLRVLAVPDVGSSAARRIRRLKRARRERMARLRDA
jgi:hypothetical protein